MGKSVLNLPKSKTCIKGDVIFSPPFTLESIDCVIPEQITRFIVIFRLVLICH